MTSKRRKGSARDEQLRQFHQSELAKRDLPNFFSIEDLSQLTEVPSKDLAAMIFATRRFYREFSIPKRNGSERVIHAPFPSLAKLQMWVLENVLTKLPHHECAVGFRKGSSIKGHVLPHIGAKQVLKVDLSDFFPTISIGMVSDLYFAAGYSSAASTILARLTTLERCLPQGAPSSPQLSNAICHGMDTSLHALANSMGIKYTRYADDLAFSGPEISSNFIHLLAEQIGESGFALNHRKTKFYYGNEPRFLTGLVIHGEHVRPPRRLRRLIRQQMHYLEKFAESDLFRPADARAQSLLLKNPMLLDVLRGRIHFWKWVEPDDRSPIHFLERLAKVEASLRIA